MGEIHELFVLALSLVWFAGATPDLSVDRMRFGWRFRDRERGGQNVPNVRGGELAPKVVLAKLGLLTPKLRIFYRNSAEKGQISGPPKI